MLHYHKAPTRLNYKVLFRIEVDYLKHGCNKSLNLANSLEWKHTIRYRTENRSTQW